MIETTCKDCVFAGYNGDKQDSCELGRLEKLGFHENEDGKTFSVERFCNTARPQAWADSLSLEETLEGLKNTVMKEVQPRIGVLIYFDTEKDQALKKLKETISQALSQKYEPRYIIVYNEKVEYNEAIQEMLSSMLSEETEHHLVQALRKFEDKSHIIDECFRHALNGWIYVTTSGEQIPKTLFETMDRIINQDMERLSIVEPYDEFNGMIFQTALFKFLNGNRVKAWAMNDLDQRPFLEKAKSLKASTDVEGCIISWEKFNEKLS